MFVFVTIDDTIPNTKLIITDINYCFFFCFAFDFHIQEESPD